MLSKLNSTTYDLLGLHGYPVPPARPAPAAAEPVRKQPQPRRVAAATRPGLRGAIARMFLASSMGHVFW